MKKILFLINNLNRGGAERTFVRQLNALHREGVPVYLGLLFETSPDGYMSELQIPPSHIFQFHKKKSKVVQAYRHVSHNRIDIVYSTLELPNIVARTLKLLKPRLTIFIREGSATIDANGRVSPKPWKFRVFDLCMNWAPSAIMAVSQEIADALRSYQPMFAHKIRVIENGVVVSESREAVVARAEAKTSLREFNVLSVASMNYHERAFEYLIEALTLLPVGLRDRTKLVFAGEGTLRARYEAQVKDSGLANSVTFLGRVDTPTLVEQYRNADVFVVCSTAEGSPNVILEAMSFGVPVITTRVGSAINMVEEPQTGFFIPFKSASAIADKLVWFSEHPKERAQMGIRSYDRVQERYASDIKMAELRSVLGI